MKSLIIVFLVFVIHVSSFTQGILYNQEFSVNTFTEYNQWHPQISVLPTGGYVICWESQYQEGLFSNGIYAQMYDSDGLKKGEEFRVNTYTENNQHYPQIATLSSGEYVICWESINFQDGSSVDIYAQMYDSDGLKKGEEFRVNTYTEDNQHYPQIAMLSSGGYVICWESSNFQDGSGDGIYAQMFSSDGLKKGEEFRVNNSTENDQRNPQIVALPSKGYVICWENPSQYSIDAQIYDLDGIRKGEEFRVNTYTRAQQRNPQLVAQHSGGFVICWEGNSDIYAQMFDSDGSKKGEEFRVNTYRDSQQFDPQMIALSSGLYVICWVSLDQDGSDSGIYSQLYDQDGVKKGKETRVNTFTKWGQGRHQIELLSSDGYLVYWSSYNQDGSGDGIYAQMFSSDGGKKGDEFRINKYTENDQSYPQIAALPSEGYVICWQSYGQDGSYNGIFAKYLFNEPINHLLNYFDLTLPSNDETVQLADPIFVWRKTNKIYQCYPWEVKYDLYISNDQKFSTPVVYRGIMDTTFQTDSLEVGKTYFWKVLAKNYEGDSLWSKNTNGFYIDPNATGVKNEETLPIEFSLSQNYPNPFNPSTMISYQLPKSSFVSLKIFDILGRELTTLVNEEKPAGSYEVEFNGSKLTSGIYFYRIQTKGYTETKKMVLMR